MPDPVDAASVGAQLATVIRKRWRAWLRALHRDIGYLAVGFTVLYALSGIAMNHIDDWDPNFVASERTIAIAPIGPELGDAEAVARLAQATGVTGTPSDVYRAGDEVRVSYPGVKITAIGAQATVQRRRDRVFFRVADWLHATRGKQAWKYIADAYAVLLLYLAISGIFMIKGRLGLRWRGTIFVVAGLAAPLGYIVASGGPGAQHSEKPTTRPGEVDAADAPRPERMAPRPEKLAPQAEKLAPEKLAPSAAAPTAQNAAAAAPNAPAPASGDGVTPLPSDDN
jgi:uncharacterized protein